MGAQACCCGNENIHENGRHHEQIRDEHLSKNQFSESQMPSNTMYRTTTDADDYNNYKTGIVIPV